MRTWQLISVLIISSSRVYSAENVCHKIENYTVTSMETYTEPVVVNTFTWCLQIPPRCPKTRTEMRQRYRVKTDVKTRSTGECCQGYTMISSNDEENGTRCVPSCEKCLFGTCVSPNVCQCAPGYRGGTCEAACPSGTWGSQCKEKCNCAQDVPCNPINGQCLCPAGLRGHTCNESCPNDRWGPECLIPCDCKNLLNKCHPETGECLEDRVSGSTESYSGNLIEETNEALNFTIEDSEGSSLIWETIESTTRGGQEAFKTTDNPAKTTSAEERTASTPDQPKIRTLAEEDGNSSTVRPVIVLVPVPERRRNSENERGKFALKNPFLRHVDDHGHLRDIVSVKTDYAKTLHKGKLSNIRADEIPPVPIPLDIAIIVVASIVSLGLTSVAVVMVLHMRSKLFETARLSIYEEQTKKQETATGNRISSIASTALPQIPVRASPLFAFAPESGTMPPVDAIESSNNYANGAAIDLRISGNFRDIPQEDHYDRPPSARIRLQSDFDDNTEHVYDEIPLQSSPLCSLRNA